MHETTPYIWAGGEAESTATCAIDAATTEPAAAVEPIREDVGANATCAWERVGRSAAATQDHAEGKHEDTLGVTRAQEDRAKERAHRRNPRAKHVRVVDTNVFGASACASKRAAAAWAGRTRPT